MPGVSRNGATLTAARWRGFRRADANVISRQIALPVIIGAAALKGARLAHARAVPPDVGRGNGGRRRGRVRLDPRSLRLIAMLERSRSLLPTPSTDRPRRGRARPCAAPGRHAPHRRAVVSAAPDRRGRRWIR